MPGTRDTQRSVDRSVWRLLAGVGFWFGWMAIPLAAVSLAFAPVILLSAGLDWLQYGDPGTGPGVGQGTMFLVACVVLGVIAVVLIGSAGASIAARVRVQTPTWWIPSLLASLLWVLAVSMQAVLNRTIAVVLVLALVLAGQAAGVARAHLRRRAASSQ